VRAWRGITCSCEARWKNLRAVSCSFCSEKQLPTCHIRGEADGTSTVLMGRRRREGGETRRDARREKQLPTTQHAYTDARSSSTARLARWHSAT
jgi:hypothetical protein